MVSKADLYKIEEEITKKERAEHEAQSERYAARVAESKKKALEEAHTTLESGRLAEWLSNAAEKKEHELIIHSDYHNRYNFNHFYIALRGKNKTHIECTGIVLDSLQRAGFEVETRTEEVNWYEEECDADGNRRTGKYLGKRDVHYLTIKW